MATQPPPTTGTPRRVTRTYPGVEAVQEPFTKIALRLLHDLLELVKGQSVPTRGTLDPDQRPVLTPLQKGFLFYSSDFDRVFIWGGQTWEDAPGQPRRGQVGWFTQAPGPGWARCDGTQVNTTQADSSIQALTTPVIDSVNGLLAWIRL